MDKLSLYQITNEIQAVENAIYSTMDEETGEVNADLVEILKSLNIAKEDKLKGCIFVINKSEDMVDLIKKEIDRLEKLKSKHEKLQEKVRNVIVNNVEVGKKLELGLHSINWRKSESVEIIDKDKFIEECLEDEASKRYLEITYKPVKKLIKEALKDGRTFEYARLEEKQNMNIK